MVPLLVTVLLFVIVTNCIQSVDFSDVYSFSIVTLSWWLCGQRSGRVSDLQ